MPTNPNMVAIQTVTVGAGGASSIEFASIPQTYTDLVLHFSGRGTQTAGVVADIDLQFNSSTANFSRRTLRGSGSAASSTSASDNYGAAVTGNSATASTFGSWQIYIPNYTSSNNKSFSIDTVTENNATEAWQYMLAGLWSNSAAISNIKVVPQTGTWMQYSSATLYGVTSAGYGAKATGGIITEDANYYYHTFLASGTFTPTSNITADYLVVAGGGGAGYGSGSPRGGGGGAGGLRCTVTATGGGGSLESAASFTNGTAYTITVGSGGAGSTATSTQGTSGSNSSIAGSGLTTITSTGGGGGGANAANDSNCNGLTGGSGGGGAGGGTSSSYGGTGGAGTTNQGYAGGSGYHSYPNYAGGGGGGGAGAAGENNSTSSTNGGNGGNGVATIISGVSTYYAGGGGGCGVATQQVSGNGGLGGGGNGNGSGAGVSGTTNTGGGGGSGSSTNGSGGSGIIVIRYAK